MSRESEVAELAARANALRAAIARAQVELKAASAQEREISERLIELTTRVEREKSEDKAEETETEKAAAWRPAPAAAAPPTPPQTRTTKQKSVEETVLTTEPGLRLARRDAWKVALAGASAATLFAAIVLTIHHEIASSSSTTTTTTPATPPPTAQPLTTPAPTPVPTPVVVGASPPEENPSPPKHRWGSPLPPPRPPAPATPPPRVQVAPTTPGELPTTRNDVEDLLAHGLDGSSTGGTGTIGPPLPPAPPTGPTIAPLRPTGLGALTVVCLPKCDHVIDNGTSLGAGHIFNRPVPSGRHVIVLSTPIGTKKTIQVDVTPNQTREIRVSMEDSRPTPRPSPSPGPNTNPNNANVNGMMGSTNNPNCAPPYYIDENGHRHYRAECLRE